MTDLHLKTYFSPLLQPFTSAKENKNRKENVQQHGLVFATTGFLRHSNLQYRLLQYHQVHQESISSA